jgi:hypothetical protein
MKNITLLGAVTLILLSMGLANNVYSQYFFYDIDSTPGAP